MHLHPNFLDTDISFCLPFLSSACSVVVVCCPPRQYGCQKSWRSRGNPTARIPILLSLRQSEEIYFAEFILSLLHFCIGHWGFSSLLLLHSFELKMNSISRLQQTFNFKQKTDIFPDTLHLSNNEKVHVTQHT